MAAYLVHPERRVMAICGDGGFMMNSQELETAVRLNMNLVVLILNDSAYGMIKWKQANMNFPDFGLDYNNPDFVKYADSYGAHGHRVDVPDVLFYHSNPRNDMDILRSYTPDDDLEKNFSGLEETILVGGHIHTQQTRRWRKHTIVVCGSVGATNDYSAGAQYVLLEKLDGEWLIRHRNVPYDVAETLRRFEETDYVTFAGPIGRLMVRGIATSTNQIMPFLSWYRSGSMEDGLSEAVDKFLTLY